MEREVRVALYGRNSDESQSPTSIDDQMRRSLDVVTRAGLKATTVLKFRDDDMSGFQKRVAWARPAFKALLAAWDNDEFDVLAVDEMSRLGRNRRQLLEVLERLDETPVRLICADGIDTDSPGAKLALGIKGVIAQEESLATSHRVKRGLYGQVHRGYMVAPPPYGYRPERLYHEDGRVRGTIWHIVEDQAEVVREMYQLRSAGKAYCKIAHEMNQRRIETRRGKLCWRASTVRRMLRNPVYRGEFLWLEDLDGVSATPAARNGQAHVRQKCAFERPELRLVSDQLWFDAQGEQVSRTGYGGGRIAYSGVIHCGYCDNILTSTAKGKAFACGSCGAERIAGAQDAPEAVPTISVAGLTEVIRYALERVLDADCIALLRERLRARLEEGPAASLAALRKRHDRLQRTAQNLLRLIGQADGPDALLDAQYRAARTELTVVERELKACEGARSAFDAKGIAAQIETDPRVLVGKLLDGKLPVEQVRSLLTQLFPKFVFVGRESRFIAKFDLEFAPGAAVAWLTGTKAVLDDRVTLRIKLIGSARRPVTWEVTEW